MTPKVGVYVQSEYNNTRRTFQTFNDRAWPGLAVIMDVLTRAGYALSYCSKSTVSRYDIILVSITAPTDFYPYIAERVQWKDFKGKVILGGAGLMNVRPVLEYADAFVLGRGEDLVIPVINGLLSKKSCEVSSNSVIYPAFFNKDNIYCFMQGQPYPHTVVLEDGKTFLEKAIGCPKKCLFCAYSWQRRHSGGIQSDTSAMDVMMDKPSDEKTIFDYDLDHPELWYETNMPFLIIGMDGFSERLRFMANKPITNEMIRKLIVSAGSRNIATLRLYNIVGYPTETEVDSKEFIDLILDIDKNYPKRDEPFFHVRLHNTPFKAMPATPAACWEMAYQDFRGIARDLRVKPYYQKHTLFRGNFIRLTESGRTEGLATIFLWALMLRGTEIHAQRIRNIATSKQFWSADNMSRLLTLEKYFSKDYFFGKFTPENLPTKYLQSYVPLQGMLKLGNKKLGAMETLELKEAKEIKNG